MKYILLIISLILTTNALAVECPCGFIDYGDGQCSVDQDFDPRANSCPDPPPPDGSGSPVNSDFVNEVIAPVDFTLIVAGIGVIGVAIVLLRVVIVGALSLYKTLLSR